MAKSTRRPAAQSEGVSTPATGERRHWLLAGGIVVVFTMTLAPSEAPAEQGGDLPWQAIVFLLAGWWLLTNCRKPRISFRFTAADVVLVATIAWIIVAGWQAAYVGASRAAINATWFWVAMSLFYLLLRQAIRSPTDRRFVLTAMFALVAVEAAMGAYQYSVSFPMMRQQYQENADALLRASGQWFPPGSPERKQLEDRLMSREPLGTFALTNSLAGVLATWLIAAAGCLWLWPVNKRKDSDRTTTGARLLRWRPIGACIVSLLLPSSVLILTKSRTAYLAVAFGVLGLAASMRRGLLWRRGIVITAALLVLAAVSIAVAIASGGLDRQVLTEAPKSVTYRLEYWQATLNMIADRPWFGVGPGQFQDRYPQYKLATASEEVADPHNFLLEVATVGGVPAAVGFVLFLLLVLVAVASRRAGSVENADFLENGNSSTIASRFVYATPLFAIFLAWLMGWIFPYLLTVPLRAPAAVAGVAVTVAVVFCWQPWLKSGMATLPLIASAQLVMLLHLSASGGMTFAGVASSLWILLALAMSGRETRTQDREVSRTWALILAGFFVVVAVTWHRTAYAPVVNSRSNLWFAQQSTLLADERIELLEAAVAADRRNSEAWRTLARVRLDQWLAEPSAEKLAAFDDAVSGWNASRPQSSSAWSDAAGFWLEVFQATRNVDALDEAERSLSRAVGLYPNSAILRARWAIVLSWSQRRSEAIAQAREALRLSDATPHADKKIPQELLTELQRLGVDGD